MYLLVASHGECGRVGVDDGVGEDVEEELGGVADLLGQVGRVHHVHNAEQLGAKLVKVPGRNKVDQIKQFVYLHNYEYSLCPEPLVSRDVDNGDWSTAVGGGEQA